VTDQANEDVARWRREVDPLLPAPPSPGQPGCGADLGPDGTCRHVTGDPATLNLTWGAARRFYLVTRVAGPDGGERLDALLTRWRDHLATQPDTADPDTAALVSWPSRDVAGVPALLRHGLVPATVIAVRPAGRRTAGARGAAGPPGLTVRRAGPADLPELVRLGMHTIAYDAHFGMVTKRPDSEDALRRETAAQLTESEPWAWIAERDGRAVGMLTAERPAATAWIAPVVAASPVAYLSLAGVEPGKRGGGVGAALAAQLHRAADATGVAVTLLHHGQVNPLSGPFWSTRGYRPLWTTWQARPARTIR
jgi:GNAT superfamily N-acetyltransferase